MNGGYLANFVATSPLVNVLPINTNDSAYSRSYGHASLTGVGIENGWHFAATNPRQIVSGNRGLGLIMIGCEGYLSSPSSVVITADELFLAGIKVKDCQFHISHTYPSWSEAPIATLPAGSNNTIDLDMRSYPECRGRGRSSSLRFIRGGNVVYRGEMVVSASGSSQTTTTEMDTLIMPVLAELPDAIGSRYYNTTRGSLSIPFAWWVYQLLSVQPD